MLTKRVFPVVLLLSLLLAACGAGAAPERTLTITGTGTVHVTPDIVSVSLAVQTQDRDVAHALAENNQSAQRLLAAARSAGVADADMGTTFFAVTPQPQYDPTTGNPTGEVIYLVDNTITVTLRDVSRLGELLQVAVDAGANNIQGVSFSVDDPSAAEDQAREQAMTDARTRAEMLATAAGATLGAPISISTSVYQPYVLGGYRVEAAMGIGGGGVPTTPGTTDVQVQVFVTYELR